MAISALHCIGINYDSLPLWNLIMVTWVRDAGVSNKQREPSILGERHFKIVCRVTDKRSYCCAAAGEVEEGVGSVSLGHLIQHGQHFDRVSRLRKR